jgi:hypothetical protein
LMVETASNGETPQVKPRAAKDSSAGAKASMSR